MRYQFGHDRRIFFVQLGRFLSSYNTQLGHSLNRLFERRNEIIFSSLRESVRVTGRMCVEKRSFNLRARNARQTWP